VHGSIQAAGREQKEKHIQTFASFIKDHAIDRDTDIFVYVYSLVSQFLVNLYKENSV
jgi:hypothetical protein